MLGVVSDRLSIPVASAAPALFTLDAGGQAAALNQDYSLLTTGNPAPRGTYIMLYATGEGQTNPEGVDGLQASLVDVNALPRPLLTVTATVGGRPANVWFAGGAPGYAGLLQANVLVPADAPIGGAVAVALQVGEAVTQPGVTIAISE